MGAPLGVRPPGPQPPAAAAAGPGMGMPRQGPASGGMRPPMPGFMPAGPPMARSAGPGGMPSAPGA
jgi:hypothetical protein